MFALKLQAARGMSPACRGVAPNIYSATSGVDMWLAEWWGSEE